jgi:hypothetical protein
LEAVAAQLKKFHGVGIGPLSKIVAVKENNSNSNVNTIKKRE